MRALLVIALLGSQAVAEPLLRHEDPELVRPELTKLVAVRSVPKGTGWVEEAREIRLYDAKGFITRHEHRKPDGSLVVSYDFTWDAAGRLLSRTYRDNTKRVERRDFSYKLDAQGRIAERVMRDPSKPAGEYHRYQYVWEADGSRRELAYRHYPKEGPYDDGQEAYDARNRKTRDCSKTHCDMIEYDAKGAVSRIRQQNREEHHYLDFDPTYDKAGMLASKTIGNVIQSFTWNARGDVTEIVEKIIASQGGAVKAKTVYTYSYR